MLLEPRDVSELSDERDDPERPPLPLLLRPLDPPRPLSRFEPVLLLEPLRSLSPLSSSSSPLTSELRSMPFLPEPMFELERSLERSLELEPLIPPLLLPRSGFSTFESEPSRLSLRSVIVSSYRGGFIGARPARH